MRRIGRARKARLLCRLAAGAGQIVEEALLSFALAEPDHVDIDNRFEQTIYDAVFDLYRD